MMQKSNKCAMHQTAQQSWRWNQNVFPSAPSMCRTIWVSSSSPFGMVQESRSPSKLGTRKRLIRECWLKRNTPPPICNVEKGLNNVSKVKFSQQVEVQRGSQTIASLGGGGIEWQPPSGLAKVWPRPKTGLFQTIAAPPPLKQKQGKCVSPGVQAWE